MDGVDSYRDRQQHCLYSICFADDKDIFIKAYTPNVQSLNDTLRRRVLLHVLHEGIESFEIYL